MYHFPVHRFVALLLLLLVPLRVFGAEAFGVCMIEHTLAQAQAMAGMPDDCPMMAQHQGGQQEKPASPDSQDCSGCQMCMPLAGPDGIHVSGTAKPETLPISSLVSFQSAEVRRALRPPIA